MKTHAEYLVRMPAYALCYLINDDASGLEPDDKSNIDRFMQPFYDEADKVSGHVIVNPMLDAGEYFSWKPAFGLACDVFDTEITILK